MSDHRGGEAYRAGAFIFSGLALLLAFAALCLAGVAWTRSNDAKDSLRKLSAAGLLGHTTNVHLEEFSMTVAPATVKAGNVTFVIKNTGSITHEMVLVRAPDIAALPRVTVATADRAVGDVDEEAIPETDLPGEATVKAGATKTVTIKLTPGTYTMICNIDTKQSDGTVLNHFQRGMHSVITAA
jgi:uncharacterized cupredoxin-like copper-binding protein